MTDATPPFDIQRIRISPLSNHEAMKRFRCATSELDAWVRNKCCKHHQQNRTQVFCAHQEGKPKILGFYCLSFATPNGNDLDDEQYKAIYKGNGIPLIYIQYLAVAEGCQGFGLGRAPMRGVRSVS